MTPEDVDGQTSPREDNQKSPWTNNPSDTKPAHSGRSSETLSPNPAFTSTDITGKERTPGLLQ